MLTDVGTLSVTSSRFGISSGPRSVWGRVLLYTLLRTLPVVLPVHGVGAELGGMGESVVSECNDNW